MPKDKSKFEKIAAKIAKIVTEKNIAYGDSFGNSATIVRALWPNGIRPDQYDDLLCVIRVIDKLFRVATRKDAFGESPWGDINGYSLLALAAEEEKKKES